MLARVLLTSFILIFFCEAKAQDAPGTGLLPVRQIPLEALPKSEGLVIEVGDFQRLYRLAGSPRIALFLNRDLQDVFNEWSSSGRQVSSSVLTNSGSDSSASNPSCTLLVAHISDVGKCSFVSSQFVETKNQTDEQKVSSQFEKGSSQAGFELGFQEKFLGYGIQVIDREIIFRNSALSKKIANGDVGKRIDRFDVETQSLLEYADYLAEVLLVQNPESEFGLSYRVNISEIKTGRMIGVAYSDGAGRHAAPEVSTRWVTTDAGYEKVVEVVFPKLSPKQVGLQVAEEALRSLYLSWSIP